MRITNKIMQNNSLANINSNKVLQDNLNTQLATKKKITKPSDDPIIAIRALRLRSNVSQVTQYYSKNVPDAESWLTVTEDALTSVSKVVTDMIKQCTDGAGEDLSTKSRQTVIDQLTALRDEVYKTGDADSAGRSLFTGYRTDSSLSFSASTTLNYSITEQVDRSKFDQLTYIDSAQLAKVNDSNYSTAPYSSITEQSITSTSIHRMRLSYDTLDASSASNIPTIQTTNSAGVVTTITPTVVSVNDATNPYTNVAAGSVYLVKETGELLFGQTAYDTLNALTDDPLTSRNESEIRINYQKSSWESGDLKPEHYFACSTTVSGTTTNYNQDYLTGTAEKQAITYDVGANQTIRVNTTADEVFTHDIGREVDELISSMQSVVDMETKVAELTKMSASTTYTTAQKATIQSQLDAANKALTLLKEKTTKLFQGGITSMKSHLENTNYQLTTVGTRSQKLELIQNRLSSQKTTFETLQSENEDADVTEVAIQLSSAELSYEAALSATGKIMKTSLMNFI